MNLLVDTSGPVFTVTEDLIGSVWILRCEARSILSGSLFTSDYFVNITVNGQLQINGYLQISGQQLVSFKADYLFSPKNAAGSRLPIVCATDRASKLFSLRYSRWIIRVTLYGVISLKIVIGYQLSQLTFQTFRKLIDCQTKSYTCSHTKNRRKMMMMITMMMASNNCVVLCCCYRCCCLFRSCCCQELTKTVGQQQRGLTDIDNIQDTFSNHQTLQNMTKVVRKLQCKDPSSWPVTSQWPGH